MYPHLRVLLGLTGAVIQAVRCVGFPENWNAPR